MSVKSALKIKQNGQWVAVPDEYPAGWEVVT